MTGHTLIATPEPRKLWVRALLMLLMCAAFQLAAWMMVLTAVAQLLFAVFDEEPNKRLQRFGSSVGLYLTQIAGFLTFATEVAPFPLRTGRRRPVLHRSAAWRKRLEMIVLSVKSADSAINTGGSSY